MARHVRAFVTNTMTLANAGTTEEVLAAFFYRHEDIIPEMFRRLLRKFSTARTTKAHDLRHFIYYIDRHIELDGDGRGPNGERVAGGFAEERPGYSQRAMRTACSSIEARIALWNGTLTTARRPQRGNGSA